MQKLANFTQKIINDNNQLLAKVGSRVLARQTARPLPEYIPTDPDEFYRDFGLLKHPVDEKPVQHLTDYQYEMWALGFKFKYRAAIKSQKIGMSTSSLMEDFQRAITVCRGKEILIIAQSFDHAKNHLYTLRKMILNSPKYSPFLINKPSELLLRDEVTKVSMMYLRNPSDPKKPTRIIALGPLPSGIWSWKEVKHIHVSDITAQQQMIDDSETFGAMFSRLANTRGTMLIESPPRGPSGKVYDIFTQSQLLAEQYKQREVLEEGKGKGKGNSQQKLQTNPMANFAIRKYPASLAVKAGLITQEFLDSEKVRLGPAYSMFYECDFFNAANTWYKSEYFKYGGYDLEL